MDTVVKPDWVVVGAPVVLYNFGRMSTNTHVTHSTIKKITDTGFSVTDDREPRFRFNHPSFDGEGFAVKQGGSWGWDRIVVPADSDRAVRELAAAQRQKVRSAARSACEKWIREPSEVNRLAAITALQHAGTEEEQVGVS